ncbi:MAG: hypothetical protein LC772_04745 [Chloroflexi bacterium]|nr:hypothetical protein [Chloroflexota bacterium]
MVSATGWYEYLQFDLFRDLKVGLVHGKIKSAEKERVMDQFRSGALNVLAATTVIEVGVDVPNATVMVIEDANRFGLAQLHQLRGRVGRGAHEGSCYLITDERYNPQRSRGAALFQEDEPPDEADIGQRRMRILVESTDGFRIAEEDFSLRGVGIYFGTAQHGKSRLRIADLHRDRELLQEARQAAFNLVQADPLLQRPEHARLRERIEGMNLQYEIQEDYTSVA